eukprot:GFUD01076323.1.p1 GENE.GFUD01076323.1~~GFUD01076323.1.p1  ORF type:complete len:122 (+),score=24.49 GFUD01076323.1:86-451(+)
MRLHNVVVAGDYLWYSIQPDYTGQEDNVKYRETLENVGEGRLEVKLLLGEHRHTENVANNSESRNDRQNDPLHPEGHPHLPALGAAGGAAVHAADFLDPWYWFVTAVSHGTEIGPKFINLL